MGFVQQPVAQIIKYPSEQLLFTCDLITFSQST